MNFMLLRRLFPNLWEPALRTRPRADLNAALIGTLASIPQTLAYGLIIGSALGEAHSGIGIVAALYGSAVVGLAAALLGGCPLILAGPRASTILVFAALIVQLRHAPALAGLAEPALVAFGIACAAAAVAGLLQVLFASFGFGRLARYVPLPVIAGFVNGSALLIILSQVWSATGVPPQKSALQLFAHLAEIRPATLLLAAATAALVLLLPRRIKRGPVMLWSVLLATAVYHLGAAFGFGAAMGGTLPPLPADFALSFIGDDMLAAFRGANAGELLRLMLPAAVSMAILSTLDTLLVTSAVDRLAMRRSDGGRQVLAEGCGNVAAALFGMAPGSSSMARTQAALRAGMVTAATPIGAALLTLIVSAALGAALPLLSQAVMAGLLIAMGIDLFDKWTLARLRSLVEHAGARSVARGDLIVVAVVVATTLVADLATAVGVGMVVALISFVMQMARSPVRRCYRATALLPRIHGDAARRAFIERHGRAIAVVEMEGALFFGSAAKLEAHVDGLIAEGVVHVVLDMKRVKDIDTTGAGVLEHIHRRLLQCGGMLAVGYVDRERRLNGARFQGADKRRQSRIRRIWLKLAYLGALRTIGEDRFFADVDAAVAQCESHLARTLPDRGAAADGAILPPTILRGVDRAMLRRLRSYLTRLEFASGAQIMTQGSAADAGYFLVAGRVDVVIDVPGTDRKLKLQTLSEGSIFGEMALIDPQPRSATVIARQASRCYCLSADALQRLKREQSDIAFVLLTNVAMIFAERIRANASMVAEMEA